MNDREKTLRAVVVLGWVQMCMVMVAMFIIDLSRSAIGEDFSNWAGDMSYGGLLVMTGVFTLYFFMPMFALVVRARWFRCVIAGVTIMATLFFVAHEIAHLLTGDMPFGMRHALDFSHHLLGIWVTTAAIQWARIDAPAAMALSAIKPA
ncbi:hypothetical protein [Verminephrobacter aporrectodeae]|uniref:hypothetical protein n=1 Tax=Verminephrobacter aporrectodeae TaxID=1110389 RepID=UPI00145FA5B8|nr:hypothetical protein [Verminephrobacter aporrectodeae]